MNISIRIFVTCCCKLRKWKVTKAKLQAKLQAKFGKIQCLMYGKKNFLYKFGYAVFEDREKRWFLFLENAPECFYCNLECETFEHLIFSCPSLQPSRNILQINNWRDVFVSTNIARLKYVVAVIRGAYSKSSTLWKIKLQTFVSWEVWKIRNKNFSI